MSFTFLSLLIFDGQMEATKTSSFARLHNKTKQKTVKDVSRLNQTVTGSTEEEAEKSERQILRFAFFYLTLREIGTVTSSFDIWDVRDNKLEQCTHRLNSGRGKKVENSLRPSLLYLDTITIPECDMKSSSSSLITEVPEGDTNGAGKKTENFFVRRPRSQNFLSVFATTHKREQKIALKMNTRSLFFLPFHRTAEEKKCLRRAEQEKVRQFFHLSNLWDSSTLVCCSSLLTYTSTMSVI